MEHRRLLAKSLVLTGVFVALVAWYLMPVQAVAVSKAQETATSEALPQVTISLTSEGIVATPDTPLNGGNYLLTIKNDTSEPRGIEMIGTDKASSPTVRYTKILQPGESEAFRWYFAEGKTVYARDIMSCSHDQRSCMMVTFGQMRKAIDVN